VHEQIYVGIDWGGYEHQLCAVDGGGRKRRELRLGHDRAGLERLEAELASLGERLPVAVERAEGILVERLMAAGHRVYPVSPRIAARARERYRVAPSKDDVFDAYVLADTLRHELARWRPLTPASAELAELRVLVRDRERLLAEQIRVEAQLRAILESYHPAAARLFSSIDRQITLAFVRRYATPEQAQRIGLARMERFLARESYRGRVPAPILLARLRGHLVGAGPGTVAGRRRSALAYCDLLELLNGKLEEFDRAVAEALARHPDADLFLSFPGVGGHTAAVLLAEIGEDRQRFPSAASLLAEAGLAPVTQSSGRTRRVRFRYAANGHLRRAFMWWAFTSIRLSPWAREAYEAGRARGLRYHRALRGLAARWARILWRCWQDGMPYDLARHLAAQQLA
jgi:transposase